jgi:hypothetical protein
MLRIQPAPPQRPRADQLQTSQLLGISGNCL